MSTAVMTQGKPEPAPALRGRMAGFFWLMTFLTGAFALIVGGRLVVPGDAAATAASILAREPLFRLSVATNLVASVCYVAATLLVYELLKPVNRSLSLLGAFFSLVGCAVGGLGSLFQLAPLVVLRGGPHLSVFSTEQVQALAFLYLRLGVQVSSINFMFFGLHCVLVGHLIFRSGFLPRAVGALLAFGGLGWLTFSLAGLLSPPLARALSPYIMLPGVLGEGALSLWLLVMGVNVRRWQGRPLHEAGA
jgi:hypothetical protein